MISVIDAHLKSTGREYLVGDKCTYADLSFATWHWLLTSPPNIMGEGFAKEWEENYPLAWKWNERMQARAAVKEARDERTKVISGK